MFDFIKVACNGAENAFGKTTCNAHGFSYRIEISLLQGILHWGEAHLILTWRMQKQRLAQVKVNQPTNKRGIKNS